MNPLDKSYIWARYVYYLRESIGVPSQRISSYMAAVKSYLGLRLTDMSFAERQGAVREALKAASRCSKEEALATVERKKNTEKLPACDEITNECIRHGWSEAAAGFQDFKGIHD